MNTWFSSVSLYVMAIICFTIMPSCTQQNGDSNGDIKNGKQTTAISENMSGIDTIRAVSKVPELTDDEINDLSVKGNSGDGKAAYELFIYYSFNTTESEKSSYWLEKSAENGYAYGQYMFGFLTIHYLGRTQEEEEKAWYWLEKAATSDDPKSARKAKEILELRLSKDDIESLTLQAEQGNRSAIFKLSMYYEYIERNQEQAKYWNKRIGDVVHK